MLSFVKIAESGRFFVDTYRISSPQWAYAENREGIGIKTRACGELFYSNRTVNVSP